MVRFHPIFIWVLVANRSYPDGMKTHQHRTKAWLPEPVARALSVNPELVQRAVEGFYVRDPAQLRVSLLDPEDPAFWQAKLMSRPLRE